MIASFFATIFTLTNRSFFDSQIHTTFEAAHGERVEQFGAPPHPSNRNHKR
jgi:hypothetical protein